MSDSYYHLGEWKVEPSLQRISKAGQVRKLEPQLMEVLQLLVDASGRVVTKDQLRSTVWAEVVITENVITRSISSLRKLLDDDPNDPTYIETISKKGYRLIAPIRTQKTKAEDHSFTLRLKVKPVILLTTTILLIILGAFAIREVFLPTSLNNAFHPLAISNSTTTEYWPAISPDGRFVAYGWKGRSDDNWDIYARLIGTETLIKLTDHSATELRAKWSSDGNYIYFLRYENGGSTIYKKPVVGGNEIRVIDSPPFSFGDFDISPDDKWISFNTRENRNSPLSILLISLETGKQTKLTLPESNYNGDIHPRFSPDGNQLAFIREKNAASMFLYTYNLRSEELSQASTAPLSINGFDWSQDGESLIYASDMAGVYKLYELNPDTRESILLRSGDYQMVMPRVASTGRIVYAKMRDNVNIWSYDRETQTAKTWFATNELNLNAVPAPNGTRVCFTKPKADGFELWVSLRDGSEAIPITQFAGQYLTAPRWSADSKYIYFQGFVNAQADIYRVDAKGGIAENMTNSNADEHTPFPIGEKIYYSSNEDGQWNIWQMNLDGTDKIKVSDIEGYTPQLANENSTIYYVKKSASGIWAFNPQLSTEKLLIPDFHPMYQGAFAVTEQGIFYYNSKDKRFEYLDFKTKNSEIIYQPQRRIPRLGITLGLFPENHTLLFSQVDEHDADIMLLEEQAD